MNILDLPLAEITVSRERFRAVDEGSPAFEALAQSMMTFGQLVPIIVTKANGAFELEDGLHRLTAARANGQATISAVIKDQLDEISQREIELETNVRRLDMSWQERNKAIALIHQMKSAKDPTWGLAQTGIIAGMPDKGNVSRQLTVAKAMRLFPELAKAESFEKALKLAGEKVKLIERVEAAKVIGAIPQDVASNILLGDSVELIKTIPDESFHAIITDPPFGVGYDAKVSGTIGSASAYKDDDESYARILSMAPDMYRVLRPNGWLIFFFGMTHYERVKTTFRSAGFTVDELPIIWDRSGGRTFTSRPDHYFNRGYDVALHAFKGDPRLCVTGRSNVIRVDPVAQADILVERPIELYEELIRRLTYPGEIIADFFAGSGSCLAAAARLQRGFFGCELSEARRATAMMKVTANLPQTGGV